MKNIFLISDTHFGHKNMYGFVSVGGLRIRREFADIEEAEEAMVERWNSVVTPRDKVYHLGDVFISRRGRFVLDRLNGDKVLIKGNHDIFSLKDYTPYFRDIRAHHRLDNIVFSHIPIHPGSVNGWWRDRGSIIGNVHGHLHRAVVCDREGNPDPQYISVCVERINYTPIEFSVIKEKLKK